MVVSMQKGPQGDSFLYQIEVDSEPIVPVFSLQSSKVGSVLSHIMERLE